MKMLAYRRVSKEEQARSGLGLAAQQQAIRLAARGRGWQLRWIEDAGHTGRTLKRPGIAEALKLLAAHQADGLVVAKLDRLSRSIIDFARIVQQSKKQGWCIVACDLNLDTSTPAGEAMANVLLTFAQFESRLIGQRTKDALAVAREKGVRLGRQRILPAPVIKRIQRQRWRGCSYRQIADRLNQARVPSACGSRWQAGNVWTAIPANVKRRIRQRKDSAESNARVYDAAVNGTKAR